MKDKIDKCLDLIEAHNKEAELIKTIKNIAGSYPSNPNIGRIFNQDPNKLKLNSMYGYSPDHKYTFKTKWCYQFCINFKNDTETYDNVTLNIISDNYNAALYKLELWLIQQQLTLLTMSLINEFKIIE